MRVAISRDGQTLERAIRQPTPATATEGIQRLIAAATELVGSETVTAVVGSIAGIFDHTKGQLVFSPNLPSWVGQPFTKVLAQQFGSVVKVENDAALAGVGEARAGAGREHSVVAFLTLSTGVGGARIVDGQIDHGTFGFEPGQQIIDPTGALCPECATPRTLENYISGRSLEKRFGQPAKEITDPAIWDTEAAWLAYGLNNVIVHWSPQIIVLGGSLMKPGGIVVEQVQAHLQKVFTLGITPPPIVRGMLGDSAGLAGAALLASGTAANKVT